MKSYLNIYYQDWPDNIWIDEVEDDLDRILTDTDAGEVTGIGMGASGENIDVEFFSEIDNNILKEIAQYLVGCGFGEDVIFDISGERKTLFECL